MRLEVGDLEGAADGICREAGLRDDESQPTILVATKILGPGSVEFIQNRSGAMGRLSLVNGRYVIGVSQSLPIVSRSHVVGHELAHWWFARENYRGDDIEEACDYVGAALVARRRPFRIALNHHGDNFRQLSSKFRTTETLVALRSAEILMHPRAVVTPSKVYARGPEWMTWPDESTLRRWASSPSKSPSVRKIRLTDDPRRVVLDVEQYEEAV